MFAAYWLIHLYCPKIPCCVKCQNSMRKSCNLVGEDSERNLSFVDAGVIAELFGLPPVPIFIPMPQFKASKAQSGDAKALHIRATFPPDAVATLKNPTNDHSASASVEMTALAHLANDDTAQESKGEVGDGTTAYTLLEDHGQNTDWDQTPVRASASCFLAQHKTANPKLTPVIVDGFACSCNPSSIAHS